MIKQADYTYDVFISYCHADREWVWDELLPQLEGAGLRVCIDDRDFEIGVPSLVNMERAVDSSCHTLIVLTPAWVESQWTAFESLLAGTADPAGRRRKIIPLMLKSCKLPSRIAMLTYADFMQAHDHANQFSRLLRQLQSISTVARSPTGELSPFATPPPIVYPHIIHQVPSAEGRFVGREQLIQELMAAVKSTRMIVILGIPGVGKTALMKQIASRLDRSHVFWYEFKPGLISLDDVLAHLARFLDSQPGYERNLIGAIRAPIFSERDRIALMIRELNAGCYYLLFESVHHIENHSALDSFFSLLKEQLRQGTVFAAGRSKPTFCTSVDEAKQLVRSVPLQGLSVAEVGEFFAQNSITLTLETAEALDARFGGLPLALELVVALLTEDLTEVELLALADEAEEQAIDYLFDEVYGRLDPAERTLLTTASLFNLPFSRSQLLGAHGAAFGEEGDAAHFTKLKRQLLIQRFAPDFYQVHEIIRALALKHADELNQHRVQLADHLVAQMPDDLSVHLEAMLLYYQAEAFDQAAELAVPIVDINLLPYDPDLAEAVLSGFKEEMVSPEQWVWLVGSQGALACSWRQYDKAEELCRRMLRLAGRLQDKAVAAIALQRLGNVYLGRDDDEKAEKYYLNSLVLEKELDDLEGQSGIYNNLGLLYIGRRQFADARSALEKGLNLLEKVDAPEWQKLSLYANLGHLYAEQEQWEEAVGFTERAQQIAEEMGSPYDVAKLTHNLGVHEDRQGNQEAARERYLKALEIAEAYGFWEIEELTRVALGKLSHKLGYPDEAIACFQRVAEMQEKIEDKARLGATYFEIGTFYWYKGDRQRALDYYEKGISLFDHLADEEQVRLYLTNIYGLAAQSAEPRRIVNALKRLKTRLLARSPSYALAKVYRTLGGIYLRLLHRDRVSLVCMRQEIALLAQLDRRREQVEALTDLGVVYEDLAHYGNALDTYTEVIELAETYDLPHLVGVARYNRANCSATLEMWQRAEDDYRRALAIAEKTEDARLQEAVYHNLGETYRRQGRVEDAVELLRSSLVSARQRSDIDDEIRTLNNLGLAYQALSQDQEALGCFHNALELSRQHYRKREESKVLISLGSFYLEGGQPDRAKDYYEQALAAARAAEDTDLEEGSILSLAYAHRQLGTSDDIAEDFQAVAERASALKHYENLVQFLTFAGEINLEEGEPEAAAEMFEQALWIALELVYDRIQEFESHVEKPSLVPEMVEVIVRICVSVDEVLREDMIEHAQTFYGSLLGKLQNTELWGETGSWMIDYLKPIGDYLAELPEQPIWEFVVAAWSDENIGDR